MNVGGSNINIGSPGTAVSSLNNILKSLGTAVGAILIVVAVIKLIISLAEENASEKVKASMMFGVGILFVSITSVLSTLGVDSVTVGTSANSVAVRVLTVIGVMVNYAGVGLILVGVVTNIFAISHENADDQVKAVKLLSSGIGALSAGGLCSYMKMLVSSNSTSTSSYVNGTINWICSILSYAAAGFIVVAIFKMINSIRNEEAKDKDASVKLFMVGIALGAMRFILKMMGFVV